jgi:hypothetical protein
MNDAILHWNEVAIEATRVDFSSDDPKKGPTPTQGGPTRTSRALAIAHLAMYDAYVGVRGGPTYLNYSAGEKPTSNDLETARAGVATAATLCLVSLYPKQRESLRQRHLEFLAQLGGADPKIARGIVWGELVASKLLLERKNDGSDASDDFYTPSSQPLRHRLDPSNPSQGFLGPLWGKVVPFGVADLTTKIPGSPPPAVLHPDYLKDFKEVKSVGRLQSETRTPEQTAIGLFWAYDGARNIGVPPRLYNQVVRAIALKRGTSEADNAKLFALVNVAMADAGIQCWHEKYKFDVWRPVVGIREASRGFGPTGHGDGNPETVSDGAWLPLGSPRTNQPGEPTSSPNFPAYPSGHATFGTAALRITQLALGLPDNFEFEVVSDELDGSSIDRDGSQRVRNRRSFTIDSAIEENVSSRVFLGVHWRFDGREGKANGLELAELIHTKFPLKA